ncbi:MAG: translocation/assembly module TamB domain-containing protein [Proteobacteria bacterium]|nr:translocation/assembly module TamB domain-containing protein [Pseudomonadota bacterium]
MKRRTRIWLLALLFTIVIYGTLFWVLCTNRGARWALEGSLHFLPAKIHIEKISGTLAGDLQLEGIRADTKGWKLGIDSIKFSWQPLYIVTGSVAIKEFVVNGISLDDKRPEVRNPLDLTWPKPPGFLYSLNGWINSFEINRLIYRSGNLKLNILDSLTTKITWFFGTFSANDLVMQSPIGKTEGNFKTTFVRPTLSANLKMTPTSMVAGMNSLVLTMKLKKGRSLEQMSGPFNIIAMSGKQENLKSAGVLGVRQYDLNINDLIINQEGRKGKLLAKGEIDFSSGVPSMDFHINVSDVNLSKELKVETALAGSLELKSDFINYRGSFNLKNPAPSWKEAHITGAFDMNLDGMKSLTIDGRIFNGTMKGELKADWVKDISLSGSFQARELDPSKITPDWQGRINVDFQGGVQWSRIAPVEGMIKADILDSKLRNRALTGSMDARWHRGVFDLVQFALHGNGFDLAASGVFNEKIDYRIRVSDLSGLIPASGGRFTADGWARWRKEQLAGMLKGNGTSISAFGTRMDAITVETLLNSDGTDLLQGKMKIRNFEYGAFKVGSLDSTVQGRVSAHNIMLTIAGIEGNAKASFNGGYTKGIWQGTVTQVACTDTRFGSFNLMEPSAIKVSSDRFALSRFSMIGSAKEKVEVDIDLAFHPMLGYAKASLQDLNIGRANLVIAKTHFMGRVSGFLDAIWPGNNIMRASATVKTDNMAISGPVSLQTIKAEGKLNWNEKGLLASWDIGAGDGGRVEGKFLSSQPAFLGMPETGQFETVWKGLDAGMMKPWLSLALDLKGSVSGDLKGRLFQGKRFEASGKTKLTQGVLAWKSDEGLISTKVEKADMDITWDGAAMKGNIATMLSNHGHLKAEFQLPIPANFPIRVERQSPIKLIAKGEVQEKGLLTAIFPGLISESQGQLTFDFASGGTWNTPDLKGSIHLADASAYLYPAGIRIQDIKAGVQLSEDHIDINSFRLSSGGGTIEGSATAWVKDWKITRYEGKFRGEKFQTVYLPELQLSTSPDLSFEGNMQKIALKGSITVPQALIQHAGNEGFVSGSSDVVIVDLPERQKKSSTMGFNMQVNVILGDQVMIKVEGMNARLEGKMSLTAHNFEKIDASGQIQVAKGRYERRGISLDITRGRIVFTGGPADLAALDILAVRNIRDIRRLKDVQAGVIITGTPRAPLVKLYSEPAMPDMDILSYIVLGKPMDVATDSNQTGLLLQAAGTMLAKDQSASLQSQLMKFAGIDTFDVQSTGGKTSSSQVSSIQPRGIAGQTVGAGSGSVSSSIVTVGKYLSPELYVAFGRSLFTNDFIVTTRYSFLKHWEVEGSRKGTDSGVDLFYKIEFK